MSLGTLDASLSLSSALERGSTVNELSCECVLYTGHHHFLVGVVENRSLVQFGVVGVCSTVSSTVADFRNVRLSMVAAGAVGELVEACSLVGSVLDVVRVLFVIAGR